jgi:hypothetical protein
MPRMRVAEMLMPIDYPVRDERRAVFRRLFEAAAQSNTVTAALAHLYGYTHPSQFEKDIEQFQRNIAETVNEHEQRLARLETILAPSIVIGSLAVDVAFHILRANNSGRGDSVMFDALCEAFPQSRSDLLEDAAAELKQYGYATTTPGMGHGILMMRPTSAMFLAFDLAATGHDTRTDTLAIAQRWLEDDATHNVFKLSEQLGWEPRRLNPAVGTLRQVFPPGHWSQEIDLTLATTSVLVTPDERFKLRRILESGRVD